MKRKLKSYKKFKLPYKPLFLALVALGGIIYFAYASGWGEQGSWKAIATEGAPEGRIAHTTIWTGQTGDPKTANKMIVWGGFTSGVTTATNTGGIYDPASNTWTATSLTNAPTPRAYHTAVWTGKTDNPKTTNRMIVHGGLRQDTKTDNGATNTGAVYDPSCDLGAACSAWVPTQVRPYMPVRAKHSAVWTDKDPDYQYRMIVWGGDSAEDTQTPTSQYPEYSAQGYNPAIDFWNGLGSPDGTIYTNRRNHTGVWTGDTGNPSTANQMIIWGGESYSNQTGPTLVHNNGSSLGPKLYDLGNWSPLPLPGAPTPRTDHTAIWTGGEMLVWGGREGFAGTNVVCGNCFTNTGAKLINAFTGWNAISTVAAPIARSEHTAVWTGDDPNWPGRMIVWGGRSGSTTATSTGGLYRSFSNTWYGTSTMFAPEARGKHTAVWTGNTGNPATAHKMIIWGGWVGDVRSAKYVNTGGIYTP